MILIGVPKKVREKRRPNGKRETSGKRMRGEIPDSQSFSLSGRKDTVSGNECDGVQDIKHTEKDRKKKINLLAAHSLTCVGVKQAKLECNDRQSERINCGSFKLMISFFSSLSFSRSRFFLPTPSLSHCTRASFGRDSPEQL